MSTPDHAAQTESRVKPSDLTREKSLWALYCLTHRFPASRFNQCATAMAALLLTAIAWSGREDLQTLTSTTRAIFGFGIALVPSILGFLIAGFTVFVTVTKVEIFTLMAQKEYGDTGESYLKYNLAAFVLAFAHYVAYLFCCVVFVLFAQPQSRAVLRVKELCEPWLILSTPAYNVFVGALLIVLGSWTLYLVLLLKSFIYNTYQVITTTVRWELERRPTRESP